MDNMNPLEKRTDSGAIIENICFARLNELCEGINKINFWRTKAGAEVDFVVHAGEAIIPVEVKYADFPSEKIPKSLTSFINSFKPERALILTRNYFGFIKKEKTEVLFYPAYYL